MQYVMEHTMRVGRELNLSPKQLASLIKSACSANREVTLDYLPKLLLLYNTTLKPYTTPITDCMLLQGFSMHRIVPDQDDVNQIVTHVLDTPDVKHFHVGSTLDHLGLISLNAAQLAGGEEDATPEPSTIVDNQLLVRLQEYLYTVEEEKRWEVGPMLVRGGYLSGLEVREEDVERVLPDLLAR